MTFKVLDHTADMKIRFSGITLEELFKQGGQGVMGIVKKRAGDKTPAVTRNIKLIASDITALLVDFLNELLTLSHINKEVYRQLNIIKINDNSLRAEVKGMPVEKFDEDIKAATYHEASVKKNKKGEWEAVVVFDV